MTIYYDPRVINVFMGGFMMGMYSSTSNTNNDVNGSRAWAATLWSGAQPTGAQFVQNFTSYRTSHLIHWQSTTWQCLDITSTGTFTKSFNMINTPISTVAASTGTATWGAVWSETFTAGQMATFTGGDTPHKAIIGPVTTTTGNGLFRLTSTSITGGTSYILDAASFNLTIPNIGS